MVDAVEARLSGPAGAGSHVVLGGRRVSPAGGDEGDGGPGGGAGEADEGAWTRREGPGRAEEGRGRQDGSGDGTSAMTGRELLLGSSFLLTAGGDGTGGTGTAWTAWGRAAGARGVLVPAASAGGLEIAARTDAQLVRMTSEAAAGSGGGNLAASQAGTSRVRLILEGSHRIGVGAGGTLTPGLEIGLRYDGGDAETGTGIEIGGALKYRDPASGLGIDVQARSLVAHEDAEYTEWGGSASLSWDADPSSEGGLSLSLGRSRGTDSGGAERLWSLEDARGLAADERGPPPGRLEAQLDYGLPVFDHRGLAIPHARWSRSDTAGTLVLGQRLRLGSATEWKVEGEFGEESRTFRAGYGFRPGDFLDLGVEASRREAADDGAPGHAITLRARMRW